MGALDSLRADYQARLGKPCSDKKFHEGIRRSGSLSMGFFRGTFLAQQLLSSERGAPVDRRAPEEAAMEDDAERHPWETDGELPWLERPSLPWESNDWAAEEDEEEAEPWHSDDTAPGWPEECAGPEYWLYKDLLD
jgi:hypothetical protein